MSTYHVLLEGLLVALECSKAKEMSVTQKSEAERFFFLGLGQAVKQILRLIKGDILCRRILRNSKCQIDTQVVCVCDHLYMTSGAARDITTIEISRL